MAAAHRAALRAPSFARPGDAHHSSGRAMLGAPQRCSWPRFTSIFWRYLLSMNRFGERGAGLRHGTTRNSKHASAVAMNRSFGGQVLRQSSGAFRCLGRARKRQRTAALRGAGLRPAATSPGPMRFGIGETCQRSDVLRLTEPRSKTPALQRSWPRGTMVNSWKPPIFT